jgi:hypothetical protein
MERPAASFSIFRAVTSESAAGAKTLFAFLT